MKEEKFTGRAILAVAASYALWLLIGFLCSLLIQAVTMICISNLDSLGDNALGILFIVNILSVLVVYGQYRLSMYTMRKICKTDLATILAFRIFGWWIIAIGAVNLILSISSGASANIWWFVFGYFFLRQAKKIKKSIGACGESKDDIP